MAGRKQSHRPHIGDDGPDLFDAQTAEKLSLWAVKGELAARSLLVVLHADPDGSKRSQIDVLDIGKLYLIHSSSLACAPTGLVGVTDRLRLRP